MVDEDFEERLQELSGSDTLWAWALGLLVPAVVTAVQFLAETQVADAWHFVAETYPSVAASVLVGLLVVLMVAFLWVSNKRGRVRRLAAQVIEKDRTIERIRERARGADLQDGGIWVAPVQNEVEFVIPSRRRPRIVSVLNLKGGVGKTTISSNLGVAIGEALGRDKRVLLVDLDWQGTLSELCVDQHSLDRIGTHSVAELLGSGIPERSLLRLMTGRARGTENVSVAVANDQLDGADFRGMLRWLMDESGDHDLRHRFRAIFHDPTSPLSDFDLILFDCPPRFSLAAVNAVAASDHVLVPINPTIKSVNAAPRTMKWLWTMQNVVGVKQVQLVLNEVRFHGDRPIRAQQTAIRDMMLTIQTMREELGAPDPTLLDAKLKDSRDLVTHAFDAPIPATTSNGRTLFEPLAKELMKIWGLS